LFEEGSNGESSADDSGNEASSSRGDAPGFTTQLETLLSSGLNPIDTPGEAGTSTVSSHDMGCG